MTEKIADPSEFMNTYDEVHAWWFGMTDALFLFKPGEPDMQESLDEPHYYRFGTICGHLIQVLVGVILGVLILT
jgi:hypothetical protein